MTTTTSNRPTCTLEDPRSACSLDDRGLKDRLARIRDEILPLIIRREPRPGVRLLFQDGPATRTLLEAWVEEERACCASLDWKLEPTATPGELRLDIQGLDPDAAWLDALAPEVRSRAGGAVPGAIRAGGIGVALSLLTFCGLPILAAALFGGTVAGAMAGFDDPLVIGAGAIAIGAGIWGFGRWRAGRGTARERSC